MCMCLRERQRALSRRASKLYVLFCFCFANSVRSLSLNLHAWCVDVNGTRMKKNQHNCQESERECEEQKELAWTNKYPINLKCKCAQSFYISKFLDCEFFKRWAKLSFFLCRSLGVSFLSLFFVVSLPFSRFTRTTHSMWLETMR